MCRSPCPVRRSAWPTATRCAASPSPSASRRSTAGALRTTTECSRSLRSCPEAPCCTAALVLSLALSVSLRPMRQCLPWLAEMTLAELAKFLTMIKVTPLVTPLPKAMPMRSSSPACPVCRACRAPTVCRTRCCTTRRVPAGSRRLQTRSAERKRPWWRGRPACRRGAVRACGQRP
ncbi:hypothetical protein BC831DRAFT_463662 [Entophlyctis helioformis]|nr:hypothetical protein BC831DRAFT_463662 [Entophlyctis helioformis]